MRVTYVTSLEWTGPVVHVHDLVPHIVDLGVEVRVLCQSHRIAEAFRATNIETVVAPLSGKKDVAGLRAQLPLLADSDVVHTHDRRTGLLARLGARLKGVPVVHTLHGLPDEIAHLVHQPNAAPTAGTSKAQLAWLSHGYPRLEGLLSLTGAVIVPSQALADFIVTRGLPKRRVYVIPSGVEVLRDVPAPRRAPIVIGTIAALIPRKGIDVLIDACSRIEERIRVVVYGDGEEQTALERRAARMNVVVEWRGHVEGARGHLEELDIFVLSSRGENLPISILEAMGMALPIVATSVGGVGELIEHEREGMLVAPEDPAALSQALTRLIRDPELCRELGIAAALRARRRFAFPEIARRTVAVYESVARK